VFAFAPMFDQFVPSGLDCHWYRYPVADVQPPVVVVSVDPTVALPVTTGADKFDGAATGA